MGVVEYEAFDVAPIETPTYVKERIPQLGAARYSTVMIASTFNRPVKEFIGLVFGLAIAVTSAHADNAPQARLVHCGQDTCLRIAGHRSRTASAIRIGTYDLAVEGGRNWHVMVPLETARTWEKPSSDALALTLTDVRTKIETVEDVALPPGALGRRVQLAMLIVRAR